MVGKPESPEHGPLFDPEPIHVLRARLPRILVETYSLADIMAGLIQPPSIYPQHRFDFTDGRRLIVSIDEDPGGQRLLHVSCSHNITYFAPDERRHWARLFRHGPSPKALAEYYADATQHFCLLLDRREIPRPAHKLLSPGKEVAHLFWRVDAIKEVRDAAG